MVSKKDNILKRLDDQYGDEPFVMMWSEYEFVLEPNCVCVNIIFKDDDGVKIAIPIGRRDVKRLRKQLKKIEQVLI